MEIYTIGFTQKSAAEFFETLKSHGIKRLIDVRLKNNSQIAGFAKNDSLKYFLKEICDADYIHMPFLSPPKELLDAYRKQNISWEKYQRRFVAFLKERKVESETDKKLFEIPTVLLCSERSPEHCHRRIVAEYLIERWREGKVIHL